MVMVRMAVTHDILRSAYVIVVIKLAEPSERSVAAQGPPDKQEINFGLGAVSGKAQASTAG
jgi:hypothetical protein